VTGANDDAESPEPACVTGATRLRHRQMAAARRPVRLRSCALVTGVAFLDFQHVQTSVALKRDRTPPGAGVPLPESVILSAGVRRGSRREQSPGGFAMTSRRRWGSLPNSAEPSAITRAVSEPSTRSFYVRQSRSCPCSSSVLSPSVSCSSC
jgi:hypothetical protein